MTRAQWLLPILIIALSMAGCNKSGPPAAGANPGNASENAPAEPVPPPPPRIPDASDWAVLAGLDNYEAACGGEDTFVSLGEPIEAIAKGLEGVMYNSEPLSDCSGMFHRVLKSIQERCPNHTTPAPEQARDTRDLARWYHFHGELVLVHDALAMSELIKPGAVLFYGHNAKRYEKFTADDLFGSPEKKGYIEHMGVVVRVERDAEGTITNYHLFHGRRTGKPSKITTWHVREKKPVHPPYGNGNQQWVAVARLLGPGTVKS